MKCHQTRTKTIKSSFLALCLLVVGTTQLVGAPKTDFDKILNKKDLDTIILEIKKELEILNPEIVEHFTKVSGIMFESRNAFFDPNNNDHLAVHAVKMEHNYVLWYNEIIINPEYACIKDKTAKLHAKLTAMLKILQKYNNSGSSILTIGLLGSELRSYEHLLPKRLNKNLISLLRKRLTRC